MESIVEMPKYESYKDSGVDWIGDIPSNWELVPIRSLFKFRNEKNDPVKTEEILSLSIANGVTRYTEEGRGGNKRKDDLTAYKIAYPGDIVLNSMNVIVGAVGMSKYYGAISPVYYALYSFSDDICTHYYEKIFQDKGFQRGLLKFGKGILIKLSGTGKLNTIRMKISTDDIKTLYFPKPPYQEQVLINKFLSHKLAQIDDVILTKEQQINLLKERKQIIIQKALTQGLIRSAPMKDSGVNWLGKIPKHWEVKRLKYVLEERNERSKTGEEPLLMMSQVHGLVVRADYHEKAEVAASNIDNKIVYENDLVFNKLKAHLGVFFKSSIPFKGIVSPDYAVYKCKAYIEDVKYLELLFRHPSYIEQFIIRATGIVEGLIRLYTGDLFDIAVPVAPPQEQREILEYIDVEGKEIDQVISVQYVQIDKLKEYKTSLINSAVSGKIKITPEMVEG